MADEEQKGTSKQKASAQQQASAEQQSTGTYYRYVGDRAMILDGGMPVGPGEYVTLTPEQLTEHNQRLVDEGRLIDASDVQP